MICCNGNCDQGDKCPISHQIEPWGFVSLLLIIVSACISIGCLYGLVALWNGYLAGL